MAVPQYMVRSAYGCIATISPCCKCRSREIRRPSHEMGVLRSDPIDHRLAPIAKLWDFQMNNNLQCKTMLWTIVSSLSLAAMPAYSQQPTGAQRDAIRSACRADYEAHCASVPPGGAASLQCLQQNMSALSSACQIAVRAVEPAAENKVEPKAEPKARENKTESKPETAPAAATSKPAAEARPAPAAKMNSAAPAAQPSSARCRRSAAPAAPTIRKSAQACRPAALPRCNVWKRTRRNCRRVARRLSRGQRRCCACCGSGKRGGRSGRTRRLACGGAGAIALRPMRPREELFVLRSACGGDVRSVCGGVQPGGGRIVQCLARNAASLSPACKEVLAPFAAR